MNYSTLKKTVAFSFASLMVAGAVNAQTTASGSTTSNAKMFGGTGQFRTWSIGVNAGVTSPTLATGGTRDFLGNEVNLGFGVSLRKQLSYAFSLEAAVNAGKVSGNRGNMAAVIDDFTGNRFVSFSTDYIQYGINGIVNIANINFLKRERGLIFFGKAGVNLANYKPTMVGYGTNGTDGPQQEYPNRVNELVIPVGVGAKFRLSQVVALNLGYTENFVNGDNFDAVRRGYPTKDRYSYGYAGLEFTLGSKDKPALEFTNPVALMYDELYDAALRREVEALKGRVTNVENAVNDLKKDSDGDGVADQFDKCPGTPAGTVVDGGGCPIVFPKQDTVAAATAGAYSNIQFEFDSSVLRTSSYPALDATSADLRTSGSAVEVQGFASSEGTAAHNLKLSRDRANSVKTYLVNSGVAASKITVKGFGETQPIADNSTEEGRVLNRRVQFKK